jgi:GAF domain-containing protein
MNIDHAAEQARQAELDRYGILDSLEDQAYDDLTRMAASVCDAPVALITLLDHGRNWFKSRIGTQATEAPREFAFCEHAIRRPGEVMVVSDAALDARFSSTPQVAGAPNIRFYAGAPLVTASGHALGTICVLDLRPRQLDATQIETLQFLAKQVMDKLDAHKAALAETPNG